VTMTITSTPNQYNNLKKTQISLSLEACKEWIGFTSQEGI